MHEIMQEDSTEYLRSCPPPKQFQESLSPKREEINSMINLLAKDKFHSLRMKRTASGTMKSLRMSYKSAKFAHDVSLRGRPFKFAYVAM